MSFRFPITDRDRQIIRWNSRSINMPDKLWLIWEIPKMLGWIHWWCLTKVIYDDEDNVWWLRGEDHILGEEDEQEEGDEGHGGPGLEGQGTGPTPTVHRCHHFHQKQSQTIFDGLLPLTRLPSLHLIITITVPTFWVWDANFSNFSNFSNLDP